MDQTTVNSFGAGVGASFPEVWEVKELMANPITTSETVIIAVSLLIIFFMLMLNFLIVCNEYFISIRFHRRR
jgi:hypothetical protein